MLPQAALSDCPAVRLEGVAESVAGGGAVTARLLLVARRVKPLLEKIRSS
jgi:hypothetical protein